MDWKARGAKEARGGERGPQGPPGIAGSNLIRVVQADQKACANGCELKCNDASETMISAICIRTGTNNQPAMFGMNQAQCRPGGLVGMNITCIRKQL